MRPALSVQNLTVTLRDGAGQRAVVDDLSFELGEGEILALVGESGSGKSKTAEAIMGLVDRASGQVSAKAMMLGNRNLAATNDAGMQGIGPAHQLADGDRIVVYVAVTTDLSAALGIRQRNHDRALVHIEAHEDIWTAHHLSSCQSVPNPPT